MKKPPFPLLLFLSILLCFFLSACGRDGLSAYELAVENGFEGSVEQWLDSLTGKDGTDGMDGAIPTVGENGNWYLGDTDTGYPSRGADGKATELAIDPSGYWVIDGRVTEHRATPDTEALLALLSDAITQESDRFLLTEQTLDNPAWNNTSSVFSGWGGSIGDPQEVDAIAVRIRARENAITEIRFHLSYGDKAGEPIVSETLTVSVPPYEEREIVWDVPVKLTGNTESLYFAYNCNQLCDFYAEYTSDAIIPPQETQAVQAYATHGRLYETAAEMTDVWNGVCRYIHVGLGRIEDVYVLNRERVAEAAREQIGVFLPQEYDLVVGDTFQLFYRGVVQAVDPYGYAISVSCAKGGAYPRYYEWTPTEQDIGSYRLTLTVRDNAGNVLGSDETTLTVRKPTETKERRTVLCIGDSLTAGGYWVAEAVRRYEGTGGAPEGLGIDCLDLIGTVERTHGETAVRYEGYGGWSWKSYCEEGSPFYDASSGGISFRTYCDKNGFAAPDIVYILLTWNGMPGAYVTDFKRDEGQLYYAQQLLDALHADFPDATVRCMGIQMPSQSGGMAADYGTGHFLGDAYGMLVTAMHYNAALEALCLSPKYVDFVRYVDVAGQFDTDYNMPRKHTPTSTRADTYEEIGSNGVHPSVLGYLQIGDAVFRSLAEVLSDS